MNRAIIPREREITSKNNLKETVAWKIPKTKHYPEGIKYSFALISKGKRAIGIDNYNYEGHHMHVGNEKRSYNFKNLHDTKEKFNKLVEMFERKQK